MKEIIFGLFPGALFIYRYAPRFELAKIVGFICMEVLPYVLACFLESGSQYSVLLGFLLTYSVYEFGYLQNDLAARKEIVGQTLRSHIASFRLFWFLLARLPICFLLIVCLRDSNPAYWTLILCQILCLLIIFFFHNVLLKPELRLGTFLSLNTLKIAIRFQILSPNTVIYIISAFPHLLIKLVHYMDSKEVLKIDKDALRKISIPIYVSSMFCIALFDWKLSVVVIPYFVNHCKTPAFTYLKSAWIKNISSKAKD